MAVAAYTALRSLATALDHYECYLDNGRVTAEEHQVKNLQNRVQFSILLLESLPHRSITPQIRNLAGEMKKLSFEAEMLLNEDVIGQLRGKGYGGLSPLDEADLKFMEFDSVIRKLQQFIFEMKRELVSYLLQNVKSMVSDVEARFSSLTLIVEDFSKEVSIIVVEIQLLDAEITDQLGVDYMDESSSLGIDLDLLIQRIESLRRKLMSDESRKESAITTAIDPNQETRLVGIEDKVNWVIEQLTSHEKRVQEITIVGMGGVGKTALVRKIRDDSRMKRHLDERGKKECIMNPLDDGSSWTLFKEKALNGEDCPVELEEFGRKIVKDCKGLPLSLVTIGGLLSKSDMSVAYWENIAKDIKGLVDYEDCKQLLSISYNYLPIHLKACFLYFRDVYEDDTIDAEGLIDRWVNYGFVKPIKEMHIVDVGKNYLNDLIDRNLVIIHNTYLTNEVSNVVIHDLFLELVISESIKEDFFSAPREGTANRERCRMCGYLGRVLQKLEIPLVIKPSAEKATTSLDTCEKCRTEYSHLIKSMKFFSFGKDCQMVFSSTTRFADFSNINLDHQFIPLPILYLWNLQFLIIHTQHSPTRQMVLPKEVWEMKQLIYIWIKGFLLPRVGGGRRKGIILKKLYYLCIDGIEGGFASARELFECAPNLKWLLISLNDSLKSYALDLQRNINICLQLEALWIYGYRNTPLCCGDMYPRSIKKLFLKSTKILKEDIDAIGSLPNLQQLQLQNSEIASEWRLVEGQFMGLKVLEIEDNTQIDFVSVEDHYFPVLEVLYLKSMKNFEIPSSFESISTLEKIYVIDCDETVNKLAMELFKIQIENGNVTIEFCLDGKWVAKSEDDQIKKTWALFFSLIGYMQGIVATGNHEFEVNSNDRI